VYTVMVKDNKATMCHTLPRVSKEILKGITGIIKHSRVTAIMGASGAGKTSLLNILACRIDRKKNVKISGDVLINGRPYEYKIFGDFANYVMQNDILMQTLTVRETLEFAASMTLNKTKQQRDAIIDKLLNDLKLEKCADVLVGGNELKGISGGERKRTSIAFELVSDPQVIFLDEPTSGLDSLTAFVIVWYMKKLAASRNKTVAMTIHQPSSEIFHLFDDFIFIVAGRLVYQGLASKSVDYFTSLGFRCP
jgi:ABC-type multidrug transport system ATPase subunit